MEGLIHITGLPRAGKTSLAVAIEIDEDMNFINWRYSASCQYIKNRNKRYGVACTLPPQRHVVHSNIVIKRKYPNMESYLMSGWEFGVPNKFYKKTRPLVPYGVYIFDEAQRYFDSKGDRELPPWVTQAFELRGHIFLKIILITQRPPRLHKDVRSICDIRIHVEKSIHTYLIGEKKVKSRKFLDTGRLIETTWYGREFNTMGDHEAYVDAKGSEGKKLGKCFKYTFKGDIKSHYDPYAYAVEMENLDNDYSYENYDVPDSKPAEWLNYKKELKNEWKTMKEETLQT